MTAEKAFEAWQVTLPTEPDEPIVRTRVLCPWSTMPKSIFAAGFSAGETSAQRPIPVSDDDPQPPPVDVRVLGWFGYEWRITMWSGCMWAHDRIPSFWLPLPAAPERT